MFLRNSYYKINKLEHCLKRKIYHLYKENNDFLKYQILKNTIHLYYYIDCFVLTPQIGLKSDFTLIIN